MNPAHDSRANRIAAGVLGIGALGYGVAVGGLGLTFNVTPLWFGLVAVVAGLVSRQARLVAIALPLIGWGTAVLLVREGPVPHNREAAADLIGVGVGMVLASGWARAHSISTIGASMTIVSGGLAFFLAFDVDALGRWPVWAGLLAVWAVIEAIPSHLRPTDVPRH